MITTDNTRHSGLRLAAGVLTGILALYITLVAFGNITDFGTNQQFVRHVLAMDSTFKDHDLMWRAITSSALQDTAYVLIIAWETVAALVLIWGTYLWAARRDDAFARRISTYGLLMLLLLFGAGSSRSAASGSRCGRRRRGTGRIPPPASSCSAGWR